MRKVENGYIMDAPEGCPPPVYELMKKAWNLNADLRPTFHEVRVLLGQLKSATACVANSSISPLPTSPNPKS